MAESAEQERASGVVGYYDKHALELSRRYDALSFETVHATLLPYLPRVPATAIDIGAGSGRDAIELAARGFDVVAIEPSGELIKAAKSKIEANPVIWLRDNLPVLSSVPDCMTFDLVICSAVLMHLPPRDQLYAFGRLCELCAPAAVLYITFRSAEEDEQTSVYQVDIAQIVGMAAERSFRLLQDSETPDWRGRGSINWRALLFKHGD